MSPAFGELFVVGCVTGPSVRACRRSTDPQKGVFTTTPTFKDSHGLKMSPPLAFHPERLKSVVWMLSARTGLCLSTFWE
jgi:hypothetical protein